MNTSVKPAFMKGVREPGRDIGAEDENTGSRSVRRALDIFELMLRRGEPLTVAQIIAELSIPKSTAYELVRTLSEGDYLAPSGKGSGLFLGRRLFELGMAYRSHVDLLKDGSQVAEELLRLPAHARLHIRVHGGPGNRSSMGEMHDGLGQ